MTIEYTIAEADYGAYASYAIAKEPTFRKAAQNAQLGFAIVLVLGATTLMALAHVQVGAAPLLPVGVFLLFGVLLTWRQRYEYRNRLQKAFTKAARLCLDHSHSIEVDSEGLRIQCVISDCRVTWAGVRGVMETPRHVFVLLQSGGACIIPRERVVRGDLSAIVGEIRTFLPGRGA